MRCRDGCHQPRHRYVPGCGLGLWVPAESWVDLVAARCEFCHCLLAGMSIQQQIEDWAPLMELFGRPNEPHSMSFRVGS